MVLSFAQSLRKEARMTRPRVLLADDHAVVRDGLKLLLEEDCEIVGAVEDGRALVKEAARLAPDVVVADISMPLLNGIESTRQLRRLTPRIKVVILTMHADLTYVAEALDAGAIGVVLKSAPSEEVLAAVRSASLGKKYLSPQIARELADSVPLGAVRAAAAKPLTSRQREVLQLLAEGRSGKEIADVLCVSARTVEFHKYRLMQQLGLHSTADLTRYAIKHGVIAP
jgi:DNA-binding NarL/FixJ family response regulator